MILSSSTAAEFWSDRLERKTEIRSFEWRKSMSGVPFSLPSSPSTSPEEDRINSQEAFGDPQRTFEFDRWTDCDKVRGRGGRVVNIPLLGTRHEGEMDEIKGVKSLSNRSFVSSLSLSLQSSTQRQTKTRRRMDISQYSLNNFNHHHPTTTTTYAQTFPLPPLDSGANVWSTTLSDPYSYEPPQPPQETSTLEWDVLYQNAQQVAHPNPYSTYEDGTYSSSGSINNNIYGYSEHESEDPYSHSPSYAFDNPSTSYYYPPPPSPAFEPDQAPVGYAPHCFDIAGGSGGHQGLTSNKVEVEGNAFSELMVLLNETTALSTSGTGIISPSASEEDSARQLLVLATSHDGGLGPLLEEMSPEGRLAPPIATTLVHPSVISLPTPAPAPTHTLTTSLTKPTVKFDDDPIEKHAPQPLEPIVEAAERENSATPLLPPPGSASPSTPKTPVGGKRAKKSIKVVTRTVSVSVPPSPPKPTPPPPPQPRSVGRPAKPQRGGRLTPSSSPGKKSKIVLSLPSPPPQTTTELRKKPAALKKLDVGWKRPNVAKKGAKKAGGGRMTNTSRNAELSLEIFLESELNGGGGQKVEEVKEGKEVKKRGRKPKRPVEVVEEKPVEVTEEQAIVVDQEEQEQDESLERQVILNRKASKASKRRVPRIVEEDAEELSDISTHCDDSTQELTPVPRLLHVADDDEEGAQEELERASSSPPPATRAYSLPPRATRNASVNYQELPSSPPATFIEEDQPSSPELVISEIDSKAARKAKDEDDARALLEFSGIVENGVERALAIHPWTPVTRIPYVYREPSSFELKEMEVHGLPSFDLDEDAISPAWREATMGLTTRSQGSEMSSSVAMKLETVSAGWAPPPEDFSHSSSSTPIWSPSPLGQPIDLRPTKNAGRKTAPLPRSDHVHRILDFGSQFKPPSPNPLQIETEYFWYRPQCKVYPQPLPDKVAVIDVIPLSFTSYSTILGPKAPNDEKDKDSVFLKSQICVEGCGFQAKADMKPIRIREHFIKCSHRRKFFELVGEVDAFGMLCRLTVDSMREQRKLSRAGKVVGSTTNPAKDRHDTGAAQGARGVPNSKRKAEAGGRDGGACRGAKRLNSSLE